MMVATFAREETNKLMCKRLKERPDIPLGYREKKSLQMHGAWLGIKRAEAEGIIVENLGPAIRAAWAAVKAPACEVQAEE